LQAYRTSLSPVQKLFLYTPFVVYLGWISVATIANITALLVARNAANENIKTKGLSFVKQLVAYGSVETHNCVFKSAEVIGIGSDHFRKIRVDDNYRIDLAELRKNIEEDIKKGLQPF